MSQRAKRFVLIPGVALAVVALALFFLGRTGVVTLPWTPAAVASADSDSSDADANRADGKGKKKKGDDEEEVIPVPVELARAEARPIAAYYRASSFVEANRQVDLVSKTTGRVQKLNVEEGDWVERGAILAELENSREKIQLRQAELKLSEQRRELDRRERLLKQSLITQEEFDATRSAFDLAETERDLAKIALEETLLRAPFNGQVTGRRIVPGQHINPTEPMFTLVDFEPLRVRIHLPESVARRILPGDEVEVVAEAIEDPVPAVVERISPVVDPTTSTVKLTLLLDTDPHEIRVGGFVKVRITTDTHVDALSIPKLALVEEGGMRSVFVAEADTVRKIEVQTGLYDESHCEILDGLEAGTCVVTLGQGGLRPGSVIDVLNAKSVGWVSARAESAKAAGSDEDAPDTGTAQEQAEGEPAGEDDDGVSESDGAEEAEVALSDGSEESE